MLMKRTIFGLATILVVFLTVLAVLVVHPSRKVKAHRGCSNRTLMGDYGWTEFGTEFEYTPPQFWTFVGLGHFDGNGNFTGSEGYYIVNGVPDADNGTTSATGTYTVNSNCTVSITYTSGSDTYTDHGVIVDANGSEVIADEYGPQTGPDMTTAHLDMKKVAESDER
jgi:hypothetical protein